MTSDNERREVARKLRELGPSADKNGLSYDTACKRVDEIIGTVECGSWKVFFDRLADLIDPRERTCQMIGPGDASGRCTECGSWFAAGQMYEYCPHCGARNTLITEVDE